MLANTHKPFDTRIYQKEAASLYAHGYDVTIIVPHHESLTVDGIRIIGVPVPKKRWQQLFTCQWQILRKAKSLSRNSIMHIQDAELIMVGFVLKLLGMDSWSYYFILSSDFAS